MLVVKMPIPSYNSSLATRALMVVLQPYTENTNMCGCLDRAWGGGGGGGGGWVQEKPRRKKLEVDARAALKGLTRCTDLVGMDCGRGGTCRLDTAAALRSPLCSEPALERAKLLCDESGIDGDERAQKVPPPYTHGRPKQTYPLSAQDHRALLPIVARFRRIMG
jgi:hypothetical protein